MNRFTSDLHFFHENAIKFDNRPFSDAQDMNKRLVSNFNSIVSERDTTYFLGDIGMGGTPEEFQSLIASMRGFKILILGNHDQKSITWYYKAGFNAVLYNATIKIGGELVTMSHCPLVGIRREDTSNMRTSREGEQYFGDNWHGETRPKFSPFRLENNGQFHLHGHTHKGKDEAILGRQYDIGVCGNDWKPVTEKQLIHWVMRTKSKELKNSKQ